MRASMGRRPLLLMSSCGIIAQLSSFPDWPEICAALDPKIILLDSPTATIADAMAREVGADSGFAEAAISATRLFFGLHVFILVGS